MIITKSSHSSDYKVASLMINVAIDLIQLNRLIITKNATLKVCGLMHF